MRCLLRNHPERPRWQGQRELTLRGAWIDGRYKLVVGPAKRKNKNADQVRLFDIYADPAEKTNLADKQPEIVKRMQAALDTWRRDVRASYDGRDYPSKP